MAEFERETKETRILARVDVNGTGQVDVSLKGALAGSEPGEDGVAGRVAFTQHMLTTLATWSGMDVHVDAESKDGLEHHLVEDVALTLGRALRDAIDVGAIQRVATATVPMDDACVTVSLDLVERPYYEGPLPDPLMDHVLRSLASEAGMTLHVITLRGRDPHHVVEAAFKALALALRDATRPRAERLSTKGAVKVERSGE